MYSVKMTRKEKEDKMFRLTQRKAILENDPNKTGSGVLIAYMKNFSKLPYPEQMLRRQEWDEYYQKVRSESISYQIFKQQCEAAKKNDWKKVKELSEEIRQMRANGDLVLMSTPKHIDPFEIDNGTFCREYRFIEKEIYILTSEINAEVFVAKQKGQEIFDEQEEAPEGMPF